MRTRITLPVFMLVFAGAHADTRKSDLSVSNLTVGLMREDTDGSWHVYSRGETFPLKPNGICGIAEKSHECMWYGVEFDYSPASAKATLACTASFNKKTDVEHPDRPDASRSQTTTFEAPLEGKGHMSLPLAVYPKPDDTPAPWTVEVACAHGGKEVLRYTFTALHET